MGSNPKLKFAVLHRSPPRIFKTQNTSFMPQLISGLLFSSQNIQYVPAIYSKLEKKLGVHFMVFFREQKETTQ